MAADLPDDAWGVCADSLLPHELCSLARVSQGLKRAITSCRAYRYLRPFTLTGHAGAVLSVAVKPGGTIVSGSADGWLKEWTVAGTQATCQDIVQQRARKIISVAVLPDGRIVSGNQNSQLVEKWSRTGLLRGLDGIPRENMARMLENQAAQVLNCLLYTSPSTRG